MIVYKDSYFMGNTVRLHGSGHFTFCVTLTGKESAHNVGDLGSISGLGRSPGERNGYPLHYSGLENSVDCTVHGVAKSLTLLSDFHFHFSFPYLLYCASVASAVKRE